MNRRASRLVGARLVGARRRTDVPFRSVPFGSSRARRSVVGRAERHARTHHVVVDAFISRRKAHAISQSLERTNEEAPSRRCMHAACMHLFVFPHPRLRTSSLHPTSQTSRSKPSQTPSIAGHSFFHFPPLLTVVSISRSPIIDDSDLACERTRRRVVTHQ